MKHLLACCVVPCLLLAQEPKEYELWVKDKVVSCYNQFVPLLAPTNLPFFRTYTCPFSIDEQLGINITENHMGRTIYVYGPFGFSFNLENKRRRSMSNRLLREYIRTNYVQRTPDWSLDQVLKQARSYLKLLDVDIDSNMRLANIYFDNIEYKSWQVLWTPCFNGYDYDTSPPFDQQISVWLNEKYGFLGYSERVFAPSPKQTVVKVSKEFAILKASKAISLIQKSPYYLQCRMPGFVASGLHKAELLIAAPNWLLDPKRAIWLRDKLPDETRLCWVVTFTSVYTGKEDPGTMAVPPMFIVYIDAATGEIVGANFT